MITKREQYLKEREKVAKEIKELQKRRTWLTHRISLIDFRERKRKNKVVNTLL